MKIGLTLEQIEYMFCENQYKSEIRKKINQYCPGSIKKYKKVDELSMDRG